MPVGPYPVDGRVYDMDGSTVITGATVIAFNVTTQEKTSITTDTSGDFIIDLANLASGYSNGDHIQLTAHYGISTGARTLSKRHTVNTSVGMWSPGDMVLHAGAEPFGTCFVTFAGVTAGSSARNVEFYDRTYDILVFKISAVANSTEQMSFGYLGQKMEGGFIRVFSSETSGDCYCSTIVK